MGGMSDTNNAQVQLIPTMSKTQQAALGEMLRSMGSAMNGFTFGQAYGGPAKSGYTPKKFTMGALPKYSPEEEFPDPNDSKRISKDELKDPNGGSGGGGGGGTKRPDPDPGGIHKKAAALEASPYASLLGMNTMSAAPMMGSLPRVSQTGLGNSSVPMNESVLMKILTQKLAPSMTPNLTGNLPR